MSKTKELNDVINISDFIEYNETNENYDIAKNLCDKIISVFNKTGFIQIVGHGISPSLIDEALKCSNIFFNQPNELKLNCISKDKARRGYSTFGNY
jgi:isopenicillin N synthase-like dioxygenase